MQKQQITIKKNGEKVLPIIWINGQQNEINLNVILREGSSLQILGIFFGNKNHQVIFNTKVLHKGKNTKSRTIIRGIFFDTATFNNDGLVRIEKGAKGADGFFDSKILLFDDAKGRSVPSLEIDENDLKAGHASTVGRPDEEQMFYMRSRGLSKKEAERLIVSGFFNPLISLLPTEKQGEVREQIERALQ